MYFPTVSLYYLLQKLPGIIIRQINISSILLNGVEIVAQSWIKGIFFAIMFIAK